MNGAGQGGRIQLVYFTYTYEDRPLKTVEVILSRGMGKKENDGGMNPIKVQCKHIWKCHNEIPYH
jgi:hypothetical protein